MGRERTRDFKTWADAEIAYRSTAKMAGTLSMALQDVVLGRVKWLEGLQPRRIGLSRLADAHGGIVVLVERERVVAYYLEDWLSVIQATPAPKGRDYMPEYKAWLDLRRLAAEAKTAQEAALKEAYEELHGVSRIARPKEVDQDVRTY